VKVQLVGRGLLHGGGAAQQVVGGAQGVVQLRLAAADAFDVQNVVDEARQPVGVADRDLEHLLHLLGPRGQCAA